MFVIFNWEITESFRCSIVRTYCFNCQRNSLWDHFEETEWVSFFAIKTIPFLRKSFLISSCCRDKIKLSNRRLNHMLKLKKSEAHIMQKSLKRIKLLIEQHQLSGKTEIQKNFIRAFQEMD